MKGVFVSFEGTEGSGKSTQTRMLAGFLRSRGYKVAHLWDPGSTRLGESVRKILLNPGTKVGAFAEMLLYMACRAQLVEEKVLPALKKGAVVICDRFADATLCYQGYGLGIDLESINRLNRLVTKSRMPDVTFFLDADIAKGLRRSRGVKGFSDRIERRSMPFHRRVRDGYRALARRFPRRLKAIPVERYTKEQTQQIIRGIVLDVIERRARTGPRA